MNAEEQAHWRVAMEEMDVLQTPTTEIKLIRGRSHEFPMPFKFGSPKFLEYPSGTPMNRAARRKISREARKEAKRK